jgi:hypothetical protein
VAVPDRIPLATPSTCGLVPIIAADSLLLSFAAVPAPPVPASRKILPHVEEAVTSRHLGNAEESICHTRAIESRS